MNYEAAFTPLRYMEVSDKRTDIMSDPNSAADPGGGVRNTLSTEGVVIYGCDPEVRTLLAGEEHGLIAGPSKWHTEESDNPSSQILWPTVAGPNKINFIHDRDGQWRLAENNRFWQRLNQWFDQKREANPNLELTMNLGSANGQVHLNGATYKSGLKSVGVEHLQLLNQTDDQLLPAVNFSPRSDRHQAFWNYFANCPAFHPLWQGALKSFVEVLKGQRIDFENRIVVDGKQVNVPRLALVYNNFQEAYRSWLEFEGAVGSLYMAEAINYARIYHHLPTDISILLKLPPVVTGVITQFNEVNGRKFEIDGGQVVMVVGSLVNWATISSEVMMAREKFESKKQNE